MNHVDKVWMKQCLTLAKKGFGKVSPNPLVGAVIVKNGKVIGQGYHERYGGAHAEVNAIRNALNRNEELKDSTMYINLEPCFHYGKTPPCVDAILKYGFARVVIATEDPNPLVEGKSITKLRDHGIKVNIGVLRKDAVKLNEIFFKYIKAKTPFVAIKAAQTLDGYIARKDGSSKWITNTHSRRLVHHLRNEYDAVLVGAATVINDDPLLTVRTVKGRNPIRVIIDGNFSVPIASKIFNSNARTIVYISKRIAHSEMKKVKTLTKKGIDIVQMEEKNGRLIVSQILRDLYNRKIASVLIEGGQRTYTEFINSRTVDKLHLFTAKKKFSSGIKTFGEISVSYKKRVVKNEYFGTDRHQEFFIEYV